MFLDETWTSTNMARARGRCPRGERLRSPVPHGHWKTTTFVAGLRLSGIIAPFVLGGPITHLSPRQFSRIFREETGQSPAKAVENLRLDAAGQCWRTAGIRSIR